MNMYDLTQTNLHLPDSYGGNLGKQRLLRCVRRAAFVGRRACIQNGADRSRTAAGRAGRRAGGGTASYCAWRGAACACKQLVAKLKMY